METRFKPPYEGLHAGEEIVWMAHKKSSFFLICGLFLSLFSLPLLMFNPFFGFLELFIIGIIVFYNIAVFSFCIKDRFLDRTKYFITNKRIIETKGTTIVTEIELSRFGGRPIQDFIGRRVDYYENEVPVYDIIVFDPVTSEKLIKFDNLKSSAVRELDRLKFVVVCKFCGTACYPGNEYCVECGNPIL